MAKNCIANRPIWFYNVALHTEIKLGSTPVTRKNQQLLAVILSFRLFSGGEKINFTLGSSTPPSWKQLQLLYTDNWVSRESGLFTVAVKEK